MSRVFAIADLHFGHQKVAELRGFPTVGLHNEALIEAWNSVVTKRDVVYVLGDVFQTAPLWHLNGIKKLALGNHDQQRMEVYLSFFTKVAAYYEFDGCLLSHIPVHPSQFPRYEVNVHGHTHAKLVQRWSEAINGQDGDWMPDNRYASVSVEQCPGMRPVLLRELIESRRRK